MATTTIQPYTPSGTEQRAFFEVDNTANDYSIGSVMSLSGGKAVPCAANATRPAIVVSHKIENGKTYVELDFGGAIARNVAFPSAAEGPIKWVDNHTVAARNLTARHGGYCFRVVSTNVGDVVLPPWGAVEGGEDTTT